MEEANAETKCPECGSTKVFRNGHRYTEDGEDIQRWLCSNCGHRFSDTRYKTQVLNIRGPEDRSNQLCAILEEAKKLDTATETKTVVGETRNPKPNFEADIIEHLWWMKKQGYSEVTIVGRDRRLRRLVTLGADLNNPESIKEANRKPNQMERITKRNMVFAYDLYRKCIGFTWQRPRYKAVRQLPFIPQEREIDDVIASCKKKSHYSYKSAKESGARAGEIYRLQWTDIDFEAEQ